jgi:hypothetical protein
MVSSPHEASHRIFQERPELLEIGLGDSPAGETWKVLMTVGTYFPGRGTYREKAFQEGEAKGSVKAILRTFDHREVPLTDADRTRIAECTDLGVLDRWLDLAFTVTDVRELWATEDEAHAAE